MSKDESAVVVGPKVGRPTKYNDEMPKKLLNFFDVELNQVVTKEVASQGRSVAVTEVVPNKLPTLKDLQ